ncbi:IclR family transcriptional regulator [Saccharothrix obliqua]|uniref:IclR family transcriptional regulator n=1 Tax=Saccharothrix obliqua TaxID=2861747 RepID=UPI0027E2C51A|nr:helix-turn-helix domain-containing protein [Saccharothrix obliqua]
MRGVAVVSVVGTGAGEHLDSPLHRAFAVLEALAEASRPLTLSELTRLVPLPKSTLHRLLGVLTDQGLAVRREAKCYEIGDRSHRLAGGPGRARAEKFARALTPHLLELFLSTREVVSVAVLAGTRVHYAGTLYPLQRARFAAALGSPVPAHRSAAGKLLAASAVLDHRARGWTGGEVDGVAHEFAVIRRTGLAWARGEHVPDMVEVAAPLRLGGTAPVAAVVVGGPAHRVDLAAAGRALRAVVDSVEARQAAS